MTPALVLILGVLLIYIVVSGRAEKVWRAIFE